MQSTRLIFPSLMIVLGALTLAGCDSVQGDVTADEGIRLSQTITGIRFDWSTYQRLARGSDNWPITWCEDDNQYTSWGDGGGFGGTNDDGRVSLGFARIEGDYPNFTGHNVWGGRNPENPSDFAGKVTSMLCLNGVLYGWRSTSSGAAGLRWKQIVRSRDKGATWEENVFRASRVVGDEPGRPGLPYFINYGKNYSANRDGYVYIYTIQIENPNRWEVQKPGIVWLARAPVAFEAFADTAAWEWVVTLDDDYNPTWGYFADRVPVLEDPDGMMRSSAIYNPGLNRFLMITNHTARNEGNLAVWEAPQPWGPWSLVMKEFGWPDNDPNAPPEDVVKRNFAYGNFSPKWLSTDGKRCVMVWFRPDSWNSVACEILVNDAGAT